MFGRQKPEPPKRKARSGDLSQVFIPVFKKTQLLQTTMNDSF